MERTTEFGGHFIANSKRPMIPRSLIVQMQSIQSRDAASVFILGRTKWGHHTQHLMLDRGKCNIINTLSLNIAMFVWRLLPGLDNIATWRVVVSETESCIKCLICLFGDEVRLRLNFIVFRTACSASRCDRASFHHLKKAWRQIDTTCKWNKARPNWPKSTVSFTGHCGQSTRHGGKLPRCRRQIRGLRGATLSATYLGGHLTFTSITEPQHTNSR